MVSDKTYFNGMSSAWKLSHVLSILTALVALAQAFYAVYGKCHLDQTYQSCFLSCFLIFFSCFLFLWNVTWSLRKSSLPK